MAKQINVGVGGVVKTVKEVPFSIGGVVKKAKKGVCGVGGVVKEFFASEYMLYDRGTFGNGVSLYKGTDKNTYLWISQTSLPAIQLPNTDYSVYTKFHVIISFNSDYAEKPTSIYPYPVLRLFTGTNMGSVFYDKKDNASTEVTSAGKEYTVTFDISSVTNNQTLYMCMCFAHYRTGNYLYDCYCNIHKMWME